MNLVKALKRKKKLAGEIGEHWKKIDEYNTVLEGNERPFDMDAEYAAIKEKTEELIALKVAIRAAALPIEDKINRLAELRSHISKLKDLNVKSGKVKASRFDDTYNVMTAHFDAVFKDTEIKSAEDEIEAIQDEIERYNFETKVEVKVD